MSEPQGSGTPASRHLDIVRPCHENALEALQVFNQLPNVCVGHQQAQATSGSDRGGVLSARTTVNVETIRYHEHIGILPRNPIHAPAE